MPRFLLFLAAIGLTVYAIADLAGTRSDETGGIPKWFWAIIIVLVPVVGPLAWIVFRRTGSRPSSPGRPQGSPGPRRSPGPVAPDDDPEFLRRLDQARREQARRERERREREGHRPQDEPPQQP